MPHLRPHELPATALYLEGAIRVSERGTLVFGRRDPRGGPDLPAPRELVRFALPRRVYTASHFEYVVEAATLPLSECYRGVTVHADETGMFEGLPHQDKDPRKSLHVDEVPMPEPGPGEALIAVLASAINYNTVWTSIFEPLPTFAYLRRYVVGSDPAGVVLRTGAGVRGWKPGDEIVAHCLNVELQGPDGHNDAMLDADQRIWGFETNFGGLAEIALVNSSPATARG